MEHKPSCTHAERSTIVHTYTYKSLRNSLSYKYKTLTLGTPWSRISPQKSEDAQLLKKSPLFHETRRFITVRNSLSLVSVQQDKSGWNT